MVSDQSSVAFDQISDLSFGDDNDVPPQCPCEAGPFHNSLTLLHCNIRGWLSHKDELFGHMQFMDPLPSLVLLNETLLNNSVQDPTLVNYELVGRHEGAATRRGVAVYAHKAIAPDIVLLMKSPVTERMWFFFAHPDWLYFVVRVVPQTSSRGGGVDYCFEN